MILAGLTLPISSMVVVRVPKVRSRMVMYPTQWQRKCSVVKLVKMYFKLVRHNEKFRSCLFIDYLFFHHVVVTSTENRSVQSSGLMFNLRWINLQ